MNEDYGNRDWELPCVCGHIKHFHIQHPHVINSSVCMRNDESDSSHICNYQLDNLGLVEQVARAKNLI